jgi:hypothetical protein
MFDTYGPFLLSSHDWNDIDELYKQIQADEPGLQFAIGIYIVAADSTSGYPIPWYVGRTTRREFGIRLVEHFKNGKFAELAAKGSLYIHLIALRNGNKFAIPQEATEAQTIMIEQLEQQLIDRCVGLNQSLLNKKRWSKNQIYVPGFIDKGDSDRDFPAARALAKLLKT